MSACVEPPRKQRPKSFILDGEIVALGPDGRSDFNALQNWGRSPIDVQFYAFDLLNLSGDSVLFSPLSKRQELLRSEFTTSNYIHITSPLSAQLDIVLVKIAEFGFEGVVAKRRNSIYTPGREVA